MPLVCWCADTPKLASARLFAVFIGSLRKSIHRCLELTKYATASCYLRATGHSLPQVFFSLKAIRFLHHQQTLVRFLIICFTIISTIASCIGIIITLLCLQILKVSYPLIVCLADALSIRCLYSYPLARLRSGSFSSFSCLKCYLI